MCVYIYIYIRMYNTYIYIYVCIYTHIHNIYTRMCSGPKRGRHSTVFFHNMHLCSGSPVVYQIRTRKRFLGAPPISPMSWHSSVPRVLGCVYYDI